MAKPVKTFKTFDLGDRTLKKGLYGKDVNALIDALVKNEYISKDKCAQVSGYYTVNEIVEVAIKNFQEDARLKSNGIADKATLDKLASWDKDRTKKRLGMRTLVLYDSGEDVDALVELLQKAGFSPDPSLFELDGANRKKFTEDIATAVAMFQAYNGLTVNGIPNTETIKKLKAVAK